MGSDSAVLSIVWPDLKELTGRLCVSISGVGMCGRGCTLCSYGANLCFKTELHSAELPFLAYSVVNTVVPQGGRGLLLGFTRRPMGTEIIAGRAINLSCMHLGSLIPSIPIESPKHRQE